jgi:DNA invertase Pin-like site-specific DNA recombinase
MRRAEGGSMGALREKDAYLKLDLGHTIFNAGLYLRLSKEDSDENEAESESIANQKDFLTRYVLEQGWNIEDIYIDDGYTGTNFNRPAFKRLLKAIEEGRVNLVITKNLSRLGRDYIDTGHYIERYFPQRNIRYIALNDGIDTFEKNNSNNDMTPFKAVMNDYYSRELSKNVRTAINSKRNKGKFIGSVAPYGYLKASYDKNLLVIDPETAPIVRRIYEEYSLKPNLSAIARRLNKEGILTPTMYKAQILRTRKQRISEQWNAETVKVILSNPTYAGHVAQHKNSRINYKVQKARSIPKESWVVVRNTHEPIISAQLFETVQQLLKLKSYTKPENSNNRVSHLLGGIVFCKDCGSRMTFAMTPRSGFVLICSGYKRHGSCTRHTYSEGELEQYVLGSLKGLAEEVNTGGLITEAQQLAGKRKKRQVDHAGKEIDKVESRLSEIKRTIKALYEDKLKGILTEQDFMDLSKDYQQERDSLSQRRTQLQTSRSPEESESGVDRELLQTVVDLLEFRKIPQAALVKLINRIEVTEDKQIDIHYNFTASH